MATSVVPERFGFTEATSKEGNDAAVNRGDCARICGVLKRPNNTGPLMAAIQIPANSSFLLKLSLSAKLCVMIRVIRFLRSAPVTPETQANGDSTLNSQVFSTLSA